MISVVVLTKNEEKNIIDCLESVLFADEIIVIDDYSEDNTLDLIKRLKNPKIIIFQHQLNNNFAQQRNFGLEKAQGEWILFIDADERVPLSLQYEILSHINDPLAAGDGYRIRRIDTMWGKRLEHGETGNIKLLRLARKEKGAWHGNVHEVWKVSGTVGEFNNALLHYPHPTLAEFLSEINFYTTVRAEELFRKKVRANWFTILLYPKAKFFVNYIVKRGFLDGLPGFVFAILMSFHSFLVRAKLWHLWDKK